MMERNVDGTSIRAALISIAIAVVSVVGCQATPLPMPPSARVEPRRMSLVSAQPGTVTLRGGAGAVEPGDVQLRVSSARGLSERRVRADGSFVATLPGELADVLYLEVVLEDRDLFVAAVRLAAAGAGAVEGAPAGGDADGDGSPDALDCAPGDDARGGRRCEPASCSPLPEVCNGLDDDCDGIVDDGDACTCPPPFVRCSDACADLETDLDHCGSCDAACALGEACASGLCALATSCTVNADCAAGQVCAAGTCLAAAPCATDADCAAGEVCSGGLCSALPGCSTDADCAAGQRCTAGLCTG